MSRIEGTIKQSQSDSKQSLLVNVIQSIRRGSFTKEQFESKADQIVAPGLSIRGLIQSSIDLGNVEWKNDKVVLVSGQGKDTNGHK